MQNRMAWAAFLMVFAATTLSAQPNAQEPKEIKAANDAHADPLPKGAVQRYGTLRFRTPSNIVALAWSPDGKVIAAAGVDRSVCLFERATGKLLFYLRGHKRAFGSIGFAPDGKQLASADVGGVVNVWDVATGEKRFSCAGAAFVISRDGKTLFTGGIPNEEFGSKIGWLTDLSYLNSTKPMRRWDVTTGQEGEPFGIGVPIAISRNGRHVASLTGFDGIIPLFRKAAKNQKVMIWEVASGKLVQNMDIPLSTGRFRRGQFTKTGFCYSLYPTEDAKPFVPVWLWTWRDKKRPHPLLQHGQDYLRIQFSMDNSLLSVLKSDGLTVWSLTSRKTLSRIDRGKIGYGFVAVAFSPDRKQLVTGDDGRSLRLWNVKDGKAIPGAHGHYDTIRAMALSSKGDGLYSAGDDAALRRWALRTGDELNCVTLSMKPSSRHNLTTKTNGTHFAIPSGDQVHIWNAPSATSPGKIEFANMRLLESMDIAPDGQSIVAGNARGILGSWSLASGKPLWQKQLPTNGRTIADVKFASDGRTIAIAGSDHVIRIIDAATGAQIRQFPIGAARRNTITYHFRLAFSRDGRTLACRHRNEVRFYETATGRERARIRGGDISMAFAFSANGRFAAIDFLESKSNAKSFNFTSKRIPASYGVSLWDVATQKELQRFIGHQGAVTALLFDAKANHLYSGSADTTILAWKIPPPLAIRQTTKMSDAAMRKSWRQLAANDAAAAFAAQHQLSDAENLAEFMAKHLQPAAKVDPKFITKWIGDLNSERFATRTKAERKLGNQIEQAELALRKALKKPDSLESHQRIERLLEQLKTPEGKRLQALRSLEVLEWTATPAARKLAVRLARGLSAARLTHEARETLKRMR